MSHPGHMDWPLMVSVVSDGVVFSRLNTFGERRKESVEVLRSAVIDQLEQYCDHVDPSTKDVKCWPGLVASRWIDLNRRKSSYELGVLSWNTNGRLDLRGCRESLLRRWSLKGFVYVGLIQEHFKKSGAPLFDLFGPSWWNLSSGAVGESMGRRSGGCAIFGQPALQRGQGFKHKSGRICGLFTSGGLLLSVYFPTKRPKQLVD